MTFVEEFASHIRTNLFESLDIRLSNESKLFRHFRPTTSGKPDQRLLFGTSSNWALLLYNRRSNTILCVDKFVHNRNLARKSQASYGFYSSQTSVPASAKLNHCQESRLRQTPWQWVYIRNLRPYPVFHRGEASLVGIPTQVAADLGRRLSSLLPTALCELGLVWFVQCAQYVFASYIDAVAVRQEAERARAMGLLASRSSCSDTQTVDNPSCSNMSFDFSTFAC